MSGTIRTNMGVSNEDVPAQRAEQPGRDLSHPRPVRVVLPSGVDDAGVPSGGNRYDRRICRGLPAAGWPVRELALAGTWPRPDADARGALARILADLPDGAIVLLDGLVACGVPEAVVPAAKRLAIVVLVHLPLGDEAGAPPALAAREGETLRAARAVVTTSAWAARRIIAQHGLSPERVHVVTPGVDPAPPAPGTDGASRLLCVGSLTPTKGQDVLVDALARVVDLPWRCDLVGPLARDPGYVASVRAGIERHGLGGRLRLSGPLIGAALDAIYAHADLLVLPSRVESFGMVLTEALARGIPVLASDTGGVAETVGDGPALLVPPGDPDALAAALCRWLSDAGLRDGLRQAARERRLRLDRWEVTVRCLARVLDGLR